MADFWQPEPLENIFLEDGAPVASGGDLARSLRGDAAWRRGAAPTLSWFSWIRTAVTSGSVLGLVALAAVLRSRAGSYAAGLGGRHVREKPFIERVEVGAEGHLLDERDVAFWVGHVVNKGGLCITDRSLGKEGSEPVAATCSESKRLWVYSRLHSHSLVKSSQGLCLDAPHPEKKGSKVHMWQCFPKLKAQYWDHNRTTKQLRSRRSGLCLQVADAKMENSSLSLEECKLGEPKQQWDFVYQRGAVQTQMPRIVAEGWQGQIATVRNLCLKAAAPSLSGSGILLQSCDGEGKWSYVNSTIVSPDGLCLDAYFEDNEGKVHLWKCFPLLENQQWKYDGATGLISSENGYCLDLLEAGMKNSVITTRTCDPTVETQHFIMGKEKSHAFGSRARFPGFAAAVLTAVAAVLQQ